MQRKDGALAEDDLDFLLHYNFPPFSTGEARMRFSVSRREIGHGNLALRALKPMIPVEIKCYKLVLETSMLKIHTKGILKIKLEKHLI